MNKEIYREGRLSNGLAFSVAGRARNGEAYSFSSHIDVAGHDVGLVIPEQNVIAVFDGAGGAADIGSPLQTALTAALTAFTISGMLFVAVAGHAFMNRHQNPLFTLNK